MKTTTKPKDIEHNTWEYPLVLMHPEDHYPDPFEDLEREARRYGLVAKRVTTPMSPMMSSQDWLLPAILVAIAAPIAGGFLGEIGKDMYTWLKKKLPTLWERVYGPSAPKLKWYKVTAEGAELVKGASKFGIMVRTQHGAVKLVLPEECSRIDFMQACEQFLELVEESQDSTSKSLIDINDRRNYRWGQMTLTYNPEQGNLVIVQPDGERKIQENQDK